MTIFKRQNEYLFIRKTCAEHALPQVALGGLTWCPQALTPPHMVAT